MRFVRSALVLAAVLAVAAAYVTGRHDGSAAGEANALAGRESPAAGAVRITFAYSSNLEEMMATLLPRFKAERVAVAGRPVHVDGVSASSGDVYADIVGGRLRPDAWSPASSL